MPYGLEVRQGAEGKRGPTRNYAIDSRDSEGSESVHAVS